MAKQKVTIPQIKFSGASLSKSTQSINNTTVTVITWDTEEYDTDNYHSTSTNTSRITVPFTGYYNITVTFGWTTYVSASARTLLSPKVNGVAKAEFFDLNISSGAEPSFTVTKDFYFTANDYIELEIYQDTGTARSISGDSRFQIKFLGV